MTPNPAKYKVLHFEPTWKQASKDREGPHFDNEGRCRLLPEIAGVTEEAIKDRTVKLLGVMINYKLKWADHISYVRTWFLSALFTSYPCVVSILFLD